MKYIAILLILFPILAFASDECKGRCTPYENCERYGKAGEYTCVRTDNYKCNGRCKDNQICEYDSAESLYFCATVEPAGYQTSNCDNKCSNDTNCLKSNTTGLYHCFYSSSQDKEEYANILNALTKNRLDFRGVHSPQMILVNNVLPFDSNPEHLLRISRFAIFPIIFTVAIIVFLLVRRIYYKNKFISFYFMGLMVMFSFSFVLGFVEFFSNRQFYFIYGTHLKPLSLFIFSAFIVYFILYMFLTPLYHYIKLNKGDLTPLLIEAMKLADKAKTRGLI